MNILVIGNGFDLAHGLPTKYTDFLEWIVAEVEFWEHLKMQGREMANRIMSLPLILNIPEDRKRKMDINSTISHQVELWDCINDNVWFEYFLQCDMHGDENWIDFESEISEVIQTLDSDVRGNLYDIIHRLSINFLADKFLNHQNYIDNDGFMTEEERRNYVEKPPISFLELRNILLRDLNKVIRALEIYLSDYVSELKIEGVLPEIKNIEINYVLSFNYTNTYEKIYGSGKDIEYEYIHGKANINNTINSNNMVLGIDEYLPDNRKNKDIEFIAFKKYFQRIHKETGCKYKEWVDEIKTGYEKYQRRQNDAWAEIIESFKDGSINQIPYQKQVFCEKIQEECPTHKLYIFGHSLDVTDGDILRDLILNDNVYTTIYYLNKDVMGQQIANLVKVIGQDELIKRTGGSKKTIAFKKQ